MRQRGRQNVCEDWDLPTAAEWLRIFRASGRGCRAPLLDLRTSAERARLPDATCFRGYHGRSPDRLSARLHELPARGCLQHAAGVVADSDGCAEAAVRALAARGLPAVALGRDGVLALERLSRPHALSRPLWRPAPALRDLLPRVEAGLGAVVSRRALDVGCGSGRDAAFLASRGWDVLAVDRDRALTDKAVVLGNRDDQAVCSAGGCCGGCGGCNGEFSRRGRVNGAVRTFGADLSKDAAWLRANASHLLVVVRFLRRGFLNLLPHAVLPGGFVLYEHFLRGCEEFGGPMKPSQMLNPGELGRVFQPHEFDILLEEDLTLDDGRPVTRLLARRAL